MIRTIIIEDEKPATKEKLERLLGNFTDLQLVCNIAFCGRSCRLV